LTLLVITTLVIDNFLIQRSILFDSLVFNFNIIISIKILYSADFFIFEKLALISKKVSFPLEYKFLILWIFYKKLLQDNFKASSYFLLPSCKCVFFLLRVIHALWKRIELRRLKTSRLREGGSNINRPNDDSVILKILLSRTSENIYR